MFDTWCKEVRKGGVRICLSMHDEMLFLVKKGHRDYVKRYMEKAMKEVNKTLLLNIEVKYSMSFGDRYSECH